MKRLLLIALIFTAPAFAQEEAEKEKTQVEIRMESLDGISGVASGGEADATLAAFPDKSIWTVYSNTNMRRDTLFTYCWVDEDNEPHCKEVKPE